jgi:Uma2 family endonuclease
VLETGLVTYPDVTVVCGPYRADPEDRNTIVNPRVLVEITTDSTEEYDRGGKLESYLRIDSLAAVVLVSHRERLIEVNERQSDQTFRRTEARSGASASIASIGCGLAVDEIYGASEG